jgi:hypothetical protein
LYDLRPCVNQPAMFADVSPDEWIDAVLGQALCLGPAALFEPSAICGAPVVPTNASRLNRTCGSEGPIVPVRIRVLRDGQRPHLTPGEGCRPGCCAFRSQRHWRCQVGVVEVAPQLTLLDLPASDDPTRPTPGENGRLLEARPSSMMEAARVRKGILRSLRAAIPPVHRTRRRAARQARMGVGGWGDYFSDTTSPLIYRTIGRHNARKFHIFLEN